MSNIEFSKAQKEHLVSKIQRYFEDELEHELGQFDAEFLLDFISKQLGAYYYNQGLYDAQSILQERLQNVSEAIYEIEKPTAV